FSPHLCFSSLNALFLTKTWHYHELTYEHCMCAITHAYCHMIYVYPSSLPSHSFFFSCLLLSRIATLNHILTVKGLSTVIDEGYTCR
ncbi:hypothetical protein ACN38_g4234, partial [Penicillium nordicum]